MPVGELWELLSDPHHLPRWWPRVERVEEVGEDAFTEVMRTKKGRLVRADFDVRTDARAHTLTWVQRIAGTPFASVLRAAETELRLAPAQADVAGSQATQVTIELRQQVGRHRDAPGAPGGVLTGSWLRLGSRLVRRAAARTLEEALDGLERIGG